MRCSRRRSGVLDRVALIGAVAITGWISSAGFSRTIRVPEDAATIQAGLDAAVDGDTVVVLPGTYDEGGA